MPFDLLHLFHHLADADAESTSLDGFGVVFRQLCPSTDQLSVDLARYSTLHQRHVNDHINRGLCPEAAEVDCIGYSLLLQHGPTLVQLGVSELGCILLGILPKPLSRLSGNLSGDELIAFQLDEWTEFTRDECVSQHDAVAAANHYLINSRFK